MGTRGPKPKSNMHVLPPPKNKRKSPMPGMSAKAKTIWRRIVHSYDSDHFKPQHYGMLRAYCEAEARRDQADKEYKKFPISKNPRSGVEKESPWLGILAKAESTMAQLGTKLGITYNATTVSKGDTGQRQRPKSKREGLIFKG